jgi:glutamate synthase domain-containing protein 2
MRTAFGTVAAGLTALATHDLLQKKHTLLHNYPVVGHLRFLLERIGPELRQYIVTSDDEERPFSRDQRAWVYTSSKRLNNAVSFGTDKDIEHLEGYVVFKHRTFSDVAPPSGVTVESMGKEIGVPAAKVLGGPRGRRHAFRPPSIVNVSAMSFGSLSGTAVEAMNKGCAIAGAMHNAGEGGISSHHQHGADLIMQIGTAYFGCRDAKGRFDLERLKDVVAANPVKAIEIKLSQGAKPGLGGLLPAAKISPEIAEIRGIPMGQDCASPARHAEFDSVDSMLDWVELVADATGLPVGIKSAVGEQQFWDELASLMSRKDRGVDFITIDGGEGGTGAAPLLFQDNGALPFRLAFSRVYKTFALEGGLVDDITFIGGGKLGLPDNAMVAYALGVDMVNVAREAMMSIGCIQAQKCHTDKCPTGIATQNQRLASGLDTSLKSVRLANYVDTLRRELLKVSEAVGVLHPSLIDADDIEVLLGVRKATPLRTIYGYQPKWGRIGNHLGEEISAIMRPTAPEHTSVAPSVTAQG